MSRNATVSTSNMSPQQGSSARIDSGHMLAVPHDSEANSDPKVDNKGLQLQKINIVRSIDEQPFPSYVICIGNPGVGKSTILNTLVGNTIFKSGPSLGRGLTREVKRYKKDGVTYVDTPGLDDISSRAEAASRIESLLSSLNGWAKLLFVVTLEVGRVRSGDLATVDLILSALKTSGCAMENCFSVIVNKCESAVIKLFESYDAGNRDVHAYFNYICEVRHFAALPMHGQAVGENDVALPFQEALLDFMRDAPSIRLQGETFVRLDFGVYEGRKAQLEREMCELRDTLRDISIRRERVTNRRRGNFSGIPIDMGELVRDLRSNNTTRLIVDFVLKWAQSRTYQSLRTIRMR